MNSQIYSAEEQKLHLPSPDWRDQIIYFLMIDRFNDGDKNNNDQGMGVYSPTKNNFYNGGDLQGVIDKTDYIKALGATAVWITPPVANLWWSPGVQLAGYHGYWARDFKKTDEHVGDLKTYKSLSNKLHQNGMYLIQDIVLNHVGRFFQYEGPYDPNATETNFSLITDNKPTKVPTQYPFNLIDRNNPQHKKAAIYHWTPEITNYNDSKQVLNYQLSGLNDLNTGNPVVQQALKESYGYWINEVGVDGFRVDTVKYVEHQFLNEFIHGEKGIIDSAAKTGRNSFMIFGEVFETSAPLKDHGEQKIAAYQGTKNQLELDAFLGFPLYEEISRVFSQGRPTSYMTYRLNKQMEVYKNPFLVANFVDNHDVQRFLAKGNIAGFKQAFAMIMTIPGIPVIYQGDEQAFTETRRAMFAGGYLTTEDQFNTDSEMFKFIQQLTKIRAENKIFSRGLLTVIKDNNSGPGIFAYRRQYKDKTAFILFNSADHKTLVGNLQTGLSPNQQLTLLLSENFTDNLSVDGNGAISVELNPRAILILLVEETILDHDKSNHEQLSIDPNIKDWRLKKSTVVSGLISKPDTELQLVIDSNLDRAIKIAVDPQGRWQTVLAVKNFGQSQHSFEIYAPQLNLVSEKQYYQADVTKAEISIIVDDPLGDDHGRDGRYLKPKSPGFQGQMDIEQVSIKSGGQNLQISLKMKQLKSDWLASNNFDHVMFSIYFDFPNTKGLTDLPLLFSKTPDEFSWDLGHLLFGWGNQIFSTAGANHDQIGKNLSFTPILNVDEASRTIRITYKGESLGISSWQDVKVYISTWDSSGEGSYRSLSPDGGLWEFGGGAFNAPHILDDIGPILISR